MAQNKLVAYIEALIHGSHVEKHRKMMLQINYLNGLIQENETQDTSFLEKRYQVIDQYYNEEIKLAQKRIDGQTSNDEKKAKKIATYDQKAYWARRKYKTSLSKTNDPQHLETLLNDYDLKKAEERVAYLNKLEQAYPDQKITKQEDERFKAFIDKRKAIRDSRKVKAEIIQKKKHARVIQLKEITEKKIAKRVKETELLNQKIEEYNTLKVKDELVEREALTKQIIALEANQNIPNKIKQKKLHKLNAKINLIDTTNLVLENKDIHLAVSNLKMFFGGVKAVNDLTFQVKQGEIFGLIGPNGAGKTTVFNCLTQFYKATGGDMIFRNKENNIVDLYTKKTHDMINEGIARSFQNVELIWELTVIDNLLVAAHSLLVTSYVDHMLHTRKMMREERVLRTKGMNILRELGIAEYAYRSPYGLPYGILKKIELARTLMTDPSLIILDEPAAGLNDAETIELSKVIQKINKEYKITIFLVEHDMGLVMSICDTVCAISFGKMIGIGTPKEIQNNPEVRKAYLGDDSDE